MDKKKTSISGDIGAKRAREESGFFKRRIKNAGGNLDNRLHYRKPKIEGGEGPRAV